MTSLYVILQSNSSHIFLFSELVALWEVLTGDVQLMPPVINHLLEVLTLTLPYQEKARTSATSGVISYQRNETPIPKAVSMTDI